MHPEVQERLFDEIKTVFPDKNFEMEYDHFHQLTYLDMVINEVHRLSPSIPLIGRQAVEDTQIDKDLILPKGLQIIISIYHLHRRKDIWGESADKFDPDRFSSENFRQVHPFAFIPFSKGPRNCIGKCLYYYLSIIESLILPNRLRFKICFVCIEGVDSGLHPELPV